MHEKFSFSGKPSDVDTIVRQLKAEYERRGDVSPVGTNFYSVYADAQRVEVILQEPHRNERGLPLRCTRTIVADRLTNRRTMITLDIPDDEWPLLEPSWKILDAKLQHLGRLEVWQEQPPRRRPGAHIKTEGKIEKLAQLRADSIQNGRVTLAITPACARVGIKLETVKKRAPRLVERWDEPAYRFSW